MTVYFIADLHLGHVNIIKYCNRPFSCVEEMNRSLIDNWNCTVHNDDTVYILGDFCFRGNPREYLDQLKGNKILIRGNHDHNKTIKVFGQVLSLTTTGINGTTLVLCHYPLLSWDRKSYGALHLYGHTHRELNYDPNAYCVSAECINYTPITLDQLIRNRRSL